jgi:hypothetical protein
MLLAAALTAAVGVAGCTGGEGTDTPTGGGKTSTTSEPEESAQALPPGVVAATSVPTKVPNKPALRRNVTVSKCAAVSGGWAASGVAKNGGDSPTTYTITVFFTTKNATVIGTGSTKVTVDAGASKTWAVSKKMHAADPTLCVLRGVA